MKTDTAWAPTVEHELLDASLDCVKVVGLDGALLGMNPEGMCIMEIDDLGPLQGQLWSSFWPAEHKATVEAAVARAAEGSVARFSAFCPTAKGTPKHWDVVVSPIHDETGRLTRLLSISRDVTREVHLAGERAMVSRELSHRIKNLFTVVDGVVGLSARARPEVQDFATALRQRLVGLGRAVSYVYGDHGARAGAWTIHGLANELLTPYGAESRIAIGGDDLQIGEGAVTPLALVVNELATNALKYGALSSTEGTVSITTRLSGDRLEIVWREAGGRPAAEPLKAGFGTSLLDRTVKLQFGGEIERRWSADGLTVTIETPTDRLA